MLLSKDTFIFKFVPEISWVIDFSDIEPDRWFGAVPSGLPDLFT